MAEDLSKHFVENAWYCAGWAHELNSNPVAFRILDRPVVLFRTEQGQPVALRDICPHKFAPLHLGKLVGGDRIQCPYHGLEFSASGKCVFNPHGNGATPSVLDVPAYPLEERDNILWIWMGAKDAADKSAIPDYSHIGAAGRRTVFGRHKMAAHYIHIVENLMDLSHAMYVHGMGMTSNDKITAKNFEHNKGISDLRLYHGIFTKGTLARGLKDPSQPVDLWNDIHWAPASCFQTKTGAAPEGEGRESVNAVSQTGSHLLTPETAHSTHYFFANSRDFCLDDESVDEAYRAWQKRALMFEDPRILEAVDARVADASQAGMRPVPLTVDMSGTRVKRAIEKLLVAG